MTRISIEGVARAKLRLTGVAADIATGAGDGTREVAADVADEWRRNAPVDTGAYRDSIDSDGDSAFSDIDYAQYVEFGTSSNQAQPVGSQAAATEALKAGGIVTAAIIRRLPR